MDEEEKSASKAKFKELVRKTILITVDDWDKLQYVAKREKIHIAEPAPEEYYEDEEYEDSDNKEQENLTPEILDGVSKILNSTGFNKLVDFADRRLDSLGMDKEIKKMSKDDQL